MAKRGYYEFDGIDPRTGDDTVYCISLSRISKIGEKHVGKKLLDLHSVAWLGKSPTAGFEGIRHVDGAFGDPMQFVELPDPAGICLCGIPPYRQFRKDVKVPPPPGYTFCLVATTRCEIWNWFWIASDKSDEQLPVDWRKRFDRQVWPTQKR